MNDPSSVVLIFAAGGIMGCLALLVLGYLRD